MTMRHTVLVFLLLLGFPISAFGLTVVNSVVTDLAVLNPTADPDARALYYATPGDGGGGDFHGDPASTATLNGCTIVAGAVGRYFAVGFNDNFPAARCGVWNGNADNSAALQAALNLQTSIILPAASYAAPIKVLSPLTMDASVTKVDGNGASLDFTGLTAGSTALTISAPSLVSGLMQAHPLSNMYLIGPTFTSGTDAIHFAPTTISGAPWNLSVTFENVSAEGFRAMYRLGAGTVATTFDRGSYASQLYGSTLHVSGSFLDVDSGTNQGEAYYVNHVFIANSNACFNDRNSNASNTEIYIIGGTSCDGTNYILSGGVTPGTGSSEMSVFWDGHIEATHVSDYAINITNGGLRFSGKFIGASSQSHPFASVTEPYSGAGMGLTLDNVDFGDTGATFIPYGSYPATGSSYMWADGDGPVRLGHLSASGNTVVALFTAANNSIPHATAPQITDYQVWGSGTAIIDPSVYPNGTTASIKMTSGGGSQDAEIDLPCAVAAMASAQVQVKTSGVVSAGGTLQIRVSYLSAVVAETLWANSWSVLGADSATFIPLRNMPVQVRAPAGTGFCSLRIELDGPGTAWVGFPDMVINQ